MRTKTLAIVSLTVALAAAAVAGPTLAARGSAQATIVNVTAKDLSFTLSAKSAKKGAVTFRLKNTGRLPHDFKINGKKTALIGGGKSTNITVVFAKAGSYPYLCTVPGHAAAGMKGVFKIT